jgi:hypothetical protein
MVSRFLLANRAFKFEPARREIRPLGYEVAREGVWDFGVFKTPTALLTEKRPECHAHQYAERLRTDHTPMFVFLRYIIAIFPELTTRAAAPQPACTSDF